MDYGASANEIIKNVGNKENIAKLIHCSTRLRFTLVNYDKANLDALKKVDGVLGAVIASGQCQVIVGNAVVEMFDAINAKIGIINNVKKAGDTPKQKWYEIFLDFLIGIFQPLVPAIAGAGVLKSLMILFSSLGWISETNSTYQIFTFIGSAPLYFLPLLVAITTAQKLNVNVLVSVSIASVLVYPDLITLLTKGTKLFGLSVTNITYSSQVFPTILAILLYAFLEKYVTKYCPKPVRIFLVPLICMAITVPATLLLLGPIGYIIGTWITASILFLFNHLGWVATGLLAGILPLMVATGMHKALIPYGVATMTATGRELLYLPASLAHNLSEAGTCFGVAVRTKNEKMRAIAISAAISALFGITEPALYGVALQHKRALGSVMISSAITGSIVGILGIKAFALVGPGIASMTMYVDKSNAKNFLFAWLCLVIALVLSFVLTLIFWKDDVVESVENNSTVDDVKLEVPINGTVVPLTEVNDSTFSSGVLGEGIAIKPKDGTLFAPAKAEVIMTYETGHAIGLKTQDGSEILIHIGLDTVKLNGKYFNVKVKEHQMVEPGETLIEFDLDKIVAENFDPTVMMVITNKGVANNIELPALA
jgi:PTS system beta-glucosides-specific IIC component